MRPTLALGTLTDKSTPSLAQPHPASAPTVLPTRRRAALTARSLGLVHLVVLAALTGPLTAPATSPAVATAAATATTAGPTPARSTVTLTLEGDAMKAINRARARSGCAALRVNTALRVAARRHSARMARRGMLSHRVAGEATLARRVASAGYTRATMLGEVIARGPTTGPAAVRMWLASSLHRSILLNCRYRDFGAGVVRGGNGRYWWTVDFGRR